MAKKNCLYFFFFIFVDYLWLLDVAANRKLGTLLPRSVAVEVGFLQQLHSGNVPGCCQKRPGEQTNIPKADG
jgi:hypothetical protein